MIKMPTHEADRDKALKRYQVLDTPSEAAFDDLTTLAADLCETPIALISLVDSDRVWFKSSLGGNFTEIPRAASFCAQAILQPDRVLIVPDANRDERFATCSLVATDPHIRFYAGTPLVTPTGVAVGTLCVLDRVPHHLTLKQIKALQALGRQVVMQLESRATIDRLKRTVQRQRRLKQALRQDNQQLSQTRQTVQTQLIQAEKMSSLGEMVAGVAHEINNPVSFVYGNLTYVSRYIKDLSDLLELYQDHYPQPVREIQQRIEAIDLEFLLEDLPKILISMKVGADRIQQIVLSLRNFSRLDEAQPAPFDIHQGIDATLMILQHRLKATALHPGIQIVRDYGLLPPIECYAGQLNQVFMNILSNAVDALEAWTAASMRGIQPSIFVQTRCHQHDPEKAVIRFKDNGFGIPEAVRARIFEPFFTTKPIGKGTGLGLSISHQIVVERHGGTLKCLSESEKGTEFLIELPIAAQSMGTARSSTIARPETPGNVSIHRSLLPQTLERKLVGSSLAIDR